MIKSMFRYAVGLRAEDLLYALGLERKRRAVDHFVTATTYFVAGAIFGGCVAILLAPTSGKEMRDQISQRLRTAGERARRAAGDVRERARRARARYEVDQSTYETGAYEETAGTAS